LVVFPTDKPAKYLKQFDLDKLARRVVAREWPRQFDVAFKKAIANRR
jgi:hypothetical protein